MMKKSNGVDYYVWYNNNSLDEKLAVFIGFKKRSFGLTASG
jgi:hypothetical protein